MALPSIGDGYQFSDGNVNEVKKVGGSVLQFANGAGIYFLDTAVTAGVTTTDAPAGSIGVTTNATGLGDMFISVAGVWEFAAVA